MNTPFANILSRLRTDAELTNRELARRASVPESLISGLQRGSRRVGEANARQIGEALGLAGEELNSFILQAIDTSTRKVLKSAQGFPAALLNFMATQLDRAGVRANEVAECAYSGSEHDRLTLLLSDGRIARVSADLVVV